MMKKINWLVFSAFSLILASIVILFVSYFALRSDIRISKNQYTVSTFKVNNGWGYSIYKNNREIIRQEIIPAIPAKVPFRNKNDALVTAKFVINKIRHNQLPYVTTEDLNNLNIPLPSDH